MRYKFILFIVIALLFTSCNSNSNNPLTFVNDKKIIEYGMSKNDVESILGDGESSTFKSILYDDYIRINYRDDKICQITVEKDGELKFAKLSIGDDLSTVLSKYKHEAKLNANTYNVMFDNKCEETDNAEKCEYWLSLFFDNDKLVKISVYDAEYAKYMK